MALKIDEKVETSTKIMNCVAKKESAMWIIVERWCIRLFHSWWCEKCNFFAIADVINSQ